MADHKKTLIVNFAADDPAAPVSAYLAEHRPAELAAGIEAIVKREQPDRVILYAGGVDLARVNSSLQTPVETRFGESSLVLREPAALCHYLETGELITPCVETFQDTFEKSLAHVISAETAWREQNEGKKVLAITASGKTEFALAEIGARLISLMREKPTAPVLLGGITGRWIAPDEVEDIVITSDALFDSLYLPSAEDCSVFQAAALVQQASAISCGHCVLCREGTWQINQMMQDIIEMTGNLESLHLIKHITPLMEAGSACRFGKSVGRMMHSFIQLSDHELKKHVIEKRCACGQCSSKRIFIIDPFRCNGCGECLPICPEETIDGKSGYIHIIDQRLCTQCGACERVCKYNAISHDATVHLPRRPIKAGRYRDRFSQSR